MFTGVDGFVIFERFQVSNHFSGRGQFDRETLFEGGCHAVGFADWDGVRKQQMYFDNVPIAGGTKAHAMILHSELGTDRIQPFPNPLSGFGVGVIEQAHR
jgi:hypothetical protein